MTRLRSHLLPSLALIVAAAVALLALRDGPRATWARVTAPATAVVGTPYAATVVLAEPRDGTFLNFDLHGHGPGETPLRCIASAPAQAVSSSRSEYRFTVEVPGLPGLEKVHVVLYLSPDGHWTHHTQTASSHPVGLGSGAGAQPGPDDLPIHEPDGDSAIEVPHPPMQRAGIAGVWIVCALLALAPSVRGSARGRLPILALAFAAFALLEATDVLASAADLARDIARHRGWYEQRRGFQQVATALVVISLGAAVAAGIRRSRTTLPALVVAGGALFLAAELAGMLSLHEVDRVLAWPIGPVVLDTILRAAGAACAAAGMIRQRYSVS